MAVALGDGAHVPCRPIRQQTDAQRPRPGAIVRQVRVRDENRFDGPCLLKAADRLPIGSALMPQRLSAARPSLGRDR